MTGRAEWPPRYEWEQLGSPAEVEGLDGPPGGHDLIGVWAWLDEPAGVVRARVFPARLGIAEDEATGSAALQLCARLGRALDIRQGRGSRIRAHPRPENRVELGGLSVLVEVRDHPLI